MKPATARSLVFAAVIVFIAAPMVIVNSCADPGEPVFFTPRTTTTRPQQYASGQLGILQPTYYMAEKFAAFRYLNGGTLNTQERDGWQGSDPDEVVDWVSMTPEQIRQQTEKQRQAENDTPVARWNNLRSTFQPQSTTSPVNLQQHLEVWEQRNAKDFVSSVDNCQDAAFTTAAATLKDRAARWGGNSPTLQDWVVAQDAVFSNCTSGGTVPNAAPANAAVLLQQDRAYQIAAAHFYRSEYDKSTKEFLAIAHDTASPWSRWGDYLAARSLVRKAAMAERPKDNDWGLAVFDMSTLQQAADILRRIVAQNKDEKMVDAARAELGFVEARLDGKKRTEVLAAAIAGPAHDDNYMQDVADLRFLALHGIVGDAPLLRWLRLTGTAFDSSVGDANPTPKTISESLAAWQQDKSLPWLVAALMNADKPTDELLAAATRINKTSPAYLTVQYHRARLLLVSNRKVATRALTTEVMGVAQQQGDDGVVNALLALRMQTATSFDSMVADMPRKMQGGYSYNECSQDKCPKVATMQFDTDAAQIFNRQLSLQRWIEAASSPQLPQNLRTVLALAGWTRAYSLQDVDALKKFAVMVKPALPQDAGFEASWFVLHSSRLIPWVDQGVQQTEGYGPNTALRGGAWWCQTSDKAGVGWYDNGDLSKPMPLPAYPFLTAEDKAAASREVAKLDGQANGVALLGRRVIDYVRANPTDKRAPQALADLVVATHYGCSRQDKGPTSAISKEAFTLLHKNYPNSEWAARTKYYY